MKEDAAMEEILMRLTNYNKKHATDLQDQFRALLSATGSAASQSEEKQSPS